MTTTEGAIIFGVLGLAIGSFINAVVWRIHEHKSITRGRSECPKCHHQLQALDLVPVASWLALGGKCRYCHKPISVQYPAVEILTAGLFVLSYLQLLPMGWRGWLEFGVWLYVLTSLIIMSVYDLRWMLLPDVVMLPAMAVALIPIGVNLITGQPWHVWAGPLLAATFVGGCFYLLAYLSDGRWMGGGDIKLVTLIGLVLGARLTGVAMFVGFMSAALVSVGLLLAKVKKRSDHIPFGPFLALGCVVAMLWGHQIIDWYLRLGS